MPEDNNLTTAEPVVAPVVAPEAAPVVASAPEPLSTTVATAIETAVVAAETAPEAVVEALKAPETVLGEGLDKTETKDTPKPDEAPKEGEAKVEDTKTEDTGQSEEPASPPVYEAFALPEGITLDDAVAKEFTSSWCSELKTKADHTLMQEFGQKAVDFHVAKVKETAQELVKFYETNWEKQKNDWKETFLKDPEMGGNRFQTTVDSALTFIRTHGGTPEQQTEFKNLMEASGLGNHPAMIRLLASAGKAMSEGKPLAAPKPVTPQKSKVATMYGKSA